MTQCKSIRKDDVNVTATQLGVKVGDKFVVLPQEESHNWERHNRWHPVVGDIVELTIDDDSEEPYFYNERTSETFCESFACLARYEEKQEQEEDVIQNSISLYIAEYSSAKCGRHIEDSNGGISSAKFEVKGLTPKQYSDILTFINNMK